MMMVQRYFRRLFTAGILAVFLLAGGCEIGVNPLIFDGTPVEATFDVNSSVASFPPLVYSIDLQDVLADIDDAVDSIKIYNIAIVVENAGTNNPRVTGGITVNGNTLVSLNNTPISVFASERSIFDAVLAAQGFSYSPTIVPTLNGFLNQNPKPAVSVVASGNANQSPLHFTIRVKFYTQVFLRP